MLESFLLMYPQLHDYTDFGKKTVNSHLTDALKSGHMQYDRHCMMYHLNESNIFYIVKKPLESGHPSRDVSYFEVH